MAEVKPFDLIVNFSRNPEPHVRRNVAVALRTLKDDRAVTLLLQMALDDADGSVRDTAETELSHLDASGLTRLRSDLVSYVQSKDRARALAATGLIGRLRQKGLDLREVGGGGWRAIVRVVRDEGKWRAVRKVVEDLSLRFNRLRPTYGLRWRGWLPGILGAILIGLIVAAYVRSAVMVVLDWDLLLPYVASATFAAAVVLILSTRRKVPLIAQWDPSAAVVRDVVETGLWSLPLAMMLMVPMLRSADVEWWDALVLATIAGAGLAAGIAAVHVGNFLAANTWRNRFVAWLWQVFIGLGTAAVVQTLLLWLVRRVVDNEHEARLAEGSWLYGLPIAAALAFSLSRLDAATSTAPFRERSKSPRTRVAILVGAGALLLGLVAASRFVGRERDRPGLERERQGVASVDWTGKSGASEVRQLLLRAGSTSYQFRLAYPQRVTFSTQGALVAPGSSIVLKQFRTDNSPAEDSDPCGRPDLATDVVDSESFPGSISRLLGSGCYLLDIDVNSAAVHDLPTLLLVRSPYLRQSSLLVRLNEDLAKFVAAPQQLSEGSITSWVAPPSQTSRIVVEVTKQCQLLVNGLTRPSTIQSSDTASALTLKGASGEILAVGPALKADLKPGIRYELLTTPGPEPLSLYAEVLDSNAVDGSYSQTPAVFPFKQVAPSVVRASTEQGSTDLYIELWRKDDWSLRRGLPLASSDDPPTLSARILPGDYVVVVSLYGSESRYQKYVALPSIHKLRLEGRLEKASPWPEVK